MREKIFNKIKNKKYRLNKLIIKTEKLERLELDPGLEFIARKNSQKSGWKIQ
ncbi:hypothetical protein [Microbulbifer sp. GL-2]|uniref:hypothetical protein n=1 Tax=Microbulbifer sp. GL-2 TaxID=2591606 RepID=UPI00155AB05B|nr:hypothetical protein [Microbulbifer sp. GL-2]